LDGVFFFVRKKDQIPKVTYLLGICYHKNKDYQSAVKWLTEAVNVKFPPAILQLAHCYQSGTGVVRDDSKAIELYTQAANSGSAPAMLVLGNLSTTEQSAMDWYTKAANLNYRPAINKLYKIYKKNNDNLKAAQILTKIPNPSASEMETIGSLYFKIDKPQATEWLTKAANLGNAIAMNNLGVIYLETHKNKDEAIKWLTNAAELGIIMANRNLGVCYSIYNDIDKSIEWYTKAAELKDEVSMCRLANLYYLRKSNTPKAIEWYTKAADLGSVDAMLKLGEIFEYNTKDYTSAIEWYTKVANLKNTSAMRKLGDLYYYKIKDIPKATEWYTTAATLDDPEAYFILGQRIYTGLESLKYFAQAISKSTDKDFHTRCIIEINNRLHNDESIKTLVEKFIELDDEYTTLQQKNNILKFENTMYKHKLQQQPPKIEHHSP
jgi:uncharacterized protein